MKFLEYEPSYAVVELVELVVELVFSSFVLYIFAEVRNYSMDFFFR